MSTWKKAVTMIESFGVGVVYVGIVALLLYPALQAGGYFAS